MAKKRNYSNEDEELEDQARQEYDEALAQESFEYGLEELLDDKSEEE